MVAGGPSSSQAWSCSACTFENPGSASKCEVCGHTAPPKQASDASGVVMRRDSMQLSQELGVDRATARAILEAQGPSVSSTAALSPLPLALPSAAKPISSPSASPPKDMTLDEKHSAVSKVEHASPEQNPNLFKHHSQVLSEQLGVDRATARAILDAQNSSEQKASPALKEEVVDAVQLHEGTRECVGCLEDLPLADMFVLGCPDAHRLCVPCVKRLVTDALEKGILPACPHRCTYSMSASEVRGLFGEGRLLSLHNELVLKTHIGKDPRYVPCPKPNCPEYVYVNIPGLRQKCVCPNPQCGFKYCSACKEQFHYRLACAEVGPSAEVWYNWLRRDRRDFIFQRTEEARAISTALSQAELTYQNTLKDEKWKEDNCRLCPNCSRCIYKVAGCDLMVCGRDTHGGNAQDGCGRPFHWQTAHPYVLGADRLNLPKILKDVDSQKAKNASHYLLAENKTYENKINCNNCKKKLLGPRFSCIHCPGGLDICLSCCDELFVHFERKKNGGSVREFSADHPCCNHNSSHLFQIFFEDSTL